MICGPITVPKVQQHSFTTLRNTRYTLLQDIHICIQPLASFFISPSSHPNKFRACRCCFFAYCCHLSSSTEHQGCPWHHKKIYFPRQGPIAAAQGNSGSKLGTPGGTDRDKLCCFTSHSTLCTLPSGQQELCGAQADTTAWSSAVRGSSKLSDHMKRPSLVLFVSE